MEILWTAHPFRAQAVAPEAITMLQAVPAHSGSPSVPAVSLAPGARGEVPAQVNLPLVYPAGLGRAVNTVIMPAGRSAADAALAQAELLRAPLPYALDDLRAAGLYLVPSAGGMGMGLVQGLPAGIPDLRGLPVGVPISILPNGLAARAALAPAPGHFFHPDAALPGFYVYGGNPMPLPGSGRSSDSGTSKFPPRYGSSTLSNVMLPVGASVSGPGPRSSMAHVMRDSSHVVRRSSSNNLTVSGATEGTAIAAVDEEQQEGAVALMLAANASRNKQRTSTSGAARAPSRSSPSKPIIAPASPTDSELAEAMDSGVSTPAAGNTSSRRSQLNRNVPSFADVVQHGLVPKGKVVFSVGNIEHVEVLVTKSGVIVFGGTPHPSISSFALAVLKERNPDRRACDGWREVRYKNERMCDIRRQCLQKMMKAGQL